MEKTILITLLTTFLFSACKKETTYCGVKGPLNDIGWLKDIVKDNPQNFYVYKLTYNGREGFYIVDNDPYNGGTHYNSCDNTNIYRSSPTRGTFYYSNFPTDFYLNTKYQEKIYPK